MNHSANRPAFYLYLSQLALVTSCLLALSTNVMGFQVDTKDSPKSEQKESDEDQGEKENDSDKDDEPDFLKIGSEAPALDLDYWPTDGNGLLPPVKKFESGKTYVLNFFQPDNAYSVSNLKSMVKLQSEYDDKPVQVVCICSADREKADEFFDSDVKDKDADADTYIDLLNSVSTAVDNVEDAEKSATAAYMARSGSLTAWSFIVGPTGKIEWLGRPTDVEKPLAKIVKGKWDRKKFAKTIEPQQKQLLRRLELDKLFAEWMVTIPREKRTSAEGLLEEFAAGAKDPDNKEFRIRIEAIRMQIMLQALADDADLEGLEEDLPEIIRTVTELSKDDATSALNDNAWKVYEMYEAGQVEKDSELMKAAKEMAEKSLSFSPDSGAVNDTVAHFVYLLDGDLDRAIKLQEYAIENSADTQMEELKDFLKFLKKEKATGKKKSLQKESENKESGGGDDSDF